ncbi:hypothetical protein [Polaribacter ponticola]|uniref:Uncharacterized protein n=1 Tax=Polaribacter ponticola TaxID=2978475 RepID=A0ABT5S4B1_9FLAO|nr:hypothetical protein [Polaribacter sp. MSW5]MDD7912943.1 hypothetical protein [Polaribacter sp. MSW5]
MASKKNITVFKRVTKTVKGKSENQLVAVKTDGTEKASKEAIEKLANEGVIYFELVDSIKGIKIKYSKLLSGKNYEIKQEKI